MSMSKRLQIPVSETEERLLKIAAKKSGLSLAEWARKLLRDQANKDLGPEKITPKMAIRALSEIGASVDSVDIMIKQSVKGRYK